MPFETGANASKMEGLQSRSSKSNAAALRAFTHFLPVTSYKQQRRIKCVRNAVMKLISINKSIMFSGFILILLIMLMCLASRAGQIPAFIIGGKADDIFDDKHVGGGSFIINSFESNALINMTFENGFQKIVGTDGRDSYDYYPGAMAVITPGRFPSDADECQQFIWMVCTSDPDLVQKLQNVYFPFYGSYFTNDISLKIVTNNAAPYLINSIKWYAPNYLGGAKHYPLTEYRNGYLLAELTVTKSELFNNISIPSELKFTQYTMQPSDLDTIVGLLKKKSGSIPIKKPNDIIPVELELISFTNIQISNPLSSYIPEILDKNARIIDKRFPEMGVVTVTSSGKWWTAHELYKNHEKKSIGRRDLVMGFLIIISILPLILIIKKSRAGIK